MGKSYKERPDKWRDSLEKKKHGKKHHNNGKRPLTEKEDGYIDWIINYNKPEPE